MNGKKSHLPPSESDFYWESWKVYNEIKNALDAKRKEGRYISQQEYDAYEDSWKAYNDLKNSFDTAYEEGFQKGRHDYAVETALNMLDHGEPLKKIVDCTDLSMAEVRKLARESKNKS